MQGRARLHMLLGYKHSNSASVYFLIYIKINSKDEV